MLVLYLVLMCMYSALLVRNSGCFEVIQTNSTIKRRRITPKIKGGVDVDISYFPSIVGLLEDGSQVCGGTIIGLTTILTAAHCFDGSSDGAKFSVRAGTSYRTKGGTIHVLIYYFRHENYNNKNFDYDYAIGRTRTKFKQSQVAGFVHTSVPKGAKLFVAGWGATDTDEVYEQLQYAQMTVMDKNLCKALLPNNIITSRMLCTYATKADGVTCTGDSGGPVFYGKLLAGVTSWGLSCERDTPAIASDVVHVISWIKKFI